MQDMFCKSYGTSHLAVEAPPPSATLGPAPCHFVTLLRCFQALHGRLKEQLGGVVQMRLQDCILIWIFARIADVRKRAQHMQVTIDNSAGSDRDGLHMVGHKRLKTSLLQV